LEPNNERNHTVKVIIDSNDALNHDVVAEKMMIALEKKSKIDQDIDI